jgi:serine/threonine-protein kinase OSR1/STK39
MRVAFVIVRACSFVNKKELWLVMRLLEKGSCLRILQEISKKGCGEGIKEEYIATILKEVLVGLKYLHEENGQIHRDLKAGNILLDEKGNVLVADFGVSGWLTTPGGTNKGKQTLQTFVGTPCWMAPEVMEQTAGYDYKADIWSFGITALELAKGFAPYARYPPMKVLLMTLQEDPASFDKYDDTDKDSEGRKFSSYFKDVIKICLQRQPTLR